MCDMGANSNPPGSQQGANGAGPSSLPNGGAGGGGLADEANSATVHALRHDPGLMCDWSAREQAILEESLKKFSSDSPFVRYAKIAKELDEKTVRDVALRCKWMNKRETGKKRREDQSAKKSKDKKERGTDLSAKSSSSHLATRPSAPPYSVPMEIDDDDITFQEIGGQTGQLLETNDQILKRISANHSNLQLQENASLLSQAWDNLYKISAETTDMTSVMRNMPPLPVRINEELAASILRRTAESPFMYKHDTEMPGTLHTSQPREGQDHFLPTR